MGTLRGQGSARWWRRGAGAALLCLASVAARPAPVSAQAEACQDYDACALWLGTSDEVLRGREGARIGDFGILSSPDLGDVFSRSDSARAAFAAVEARYRPSQILQLAGWGLVATSLILVRGQDDFNGRVGLACAVEAVGLTLGIVGSRKERAARRDLSRAVWWYNRELLVP